MAGETKVLEGNVRFEVFTVVTMKNGVFWNVLTRATRRNIPEDAILHTRRKSPICPQQIPT
jgi:hypothetical protein